MTRNLPAQSKLGRRRRRALGGASVAAIALLALAAVAAQVPAKQSAPESSRDPFKSLIVPPSAGGKAQLNLPPGKSGLVIDRLTVQGIALGGPTGPVGLVAQGGGTYFLRPGEHIYDGVVERLDPQGIVFQRTRVLEKTQTVGADVVRSIAAGGSE